MGRDAYPTAVWRNNMRYTPEKPIWSGTGIINFAIREKTLKEAIASNEPFWIDYEGKSAIIDPRAWIKTGKLIEKVFRFPDRPMRLWQNTLKFEPELTEEEMAKTYLL